MCSRGLQETDVSSCGRRVTLVPAELVDRDGIAGRYLRGAVRRRGIDENDLAAVHLDVAASADSMHPPMNRSSFLQMMTMDSTFARFCSATGNFPPFGTMPSSLVAAARKASSGSSCSDSA